MDPTFATDLCSYCDCWQMTGDSELTDAAIFRSFIGGTEATRHEAEAKFRKNTQQYQVQPALARPGTRQGRGTEQP
jgi:hypothetical protein